MEFGVAWGYTTNFFVTRFKNMSRIDSFDLFTGLPEGWRGLPAGYFENKGTPPPIIDQRLTFHTGFVEDKIKNLNLDFLGRQPTFILFDLDLYEPTKFTFNFIFDKLKIGDILYFDEAYDNDERRILIEEVFPRLETRCVGYTAFSIALQITGKLA